MSSCDNTHYCMDSVMHLTNIVVVLHLGNAVVIFCCNWVCFLGSRAGCSLALYQAFHLRGRWEKAWYTHTLHCACTESWGFLGLRYTLVIFHYITRVIVTVLLGYLRDIHRIYLPLLWVANDNHTQDVPFFGPMAFVEYRYIHLAFIHVLDRGHSAKMLHAFCAIIIWWEQ